MSRARKLRTRRDIGEKKKERKKERKKKNQPGTRPIFAILPFRVSRFPLSDTTKRGRFVPRRVISARLLARPTKK